MKLIGQKNIVIIFVFVTVLFSQCNNGDNPLVNKNEKQLKLEIIYSGEVSINWDSTVYQHTIDWKVFLDITAYDSLANLLKESEISIEAMWCPNQDTDCLILLRAGSEIIIKLNKPDTLIYSYGFQNNDVGFPIDCFPSWRHYKFIYE